MPDGPTTRVICPGTSARGNLQRGQWLQQRDAINLQRRRQCRSISTCGFTARGGKRHIAAPQLQGRPRRTQLLHALPGGHQIRQQAAQQQADGDQRGAIGALPQVGHHQNAGDGGHCGELQQQAAVGHQCLLLRVALPQAIGNARVVAGFDILALERAHVAQPPREVLAQPEQPGHVGHVVATDTGLLRTARSPQPAPGQHQQHRRGGSQTRHDQQRQTHTHHCGDAGHQQLQHRTEPCVAISML